MAEIILSKLIIDNFKGCRHFELAPNRRGCTISGENAAGKTTIFDAYMWLLWGKDSRGRKDFDIKPLLPDGIVADHAAITSVEGEFWADGQPVTLKRTYYERWSTKRGRSEATFDGHSSDFYVDEVPTQKGAFDAAVVQLVGDEETFRILTSVTYFPEQMKWQDRRVKLSELAGVMSDQEIMATDERFRDLPDEMGSRSVEDYKKMLSAQRKTLARAKTDIPARIDEQAQTVRELERVDFDGLRRQRDDLDRRITDAIQQLNQATSTDAGEVFTAQIAAVEAEIRTMDADNASRKAQLSAADTGRKSVQHRIEITNTLIDKAREDLKVLNDDISQRGQEIEAKRAEYLAVAGEEFQGEDTCPTCGQKLPKARLDKAVATFNATKRLRLEDIKARAEELKARLETLEKRAEDKGLYIADLEKSRDTALDELAAMPEPDPVTDMPGYAENRAALENKIRQLRKLAAQANAPAEQTVSELEATIRGLKQDVEQLNQSIAQEGRLTVARQRIDYLRDQAKKTSAELEGIDGKLFLLEDFSRYKAGFVEDTINGMFEHARFRLFRDQINGGLEECCDVVYGGVPYSSLNNGARINIGIDIIRTFGEKTGTTVPLFVDNAEAVTELWTTGGQMIQLKVDGKKKELTVK